jgi:hypothetical protein
MLAVRPPSARERRDTVSRLVAEPGRSITLLEAFDASCADLWLAWDDASAWRAAEVELVGRNVGTEAVLARVELAQVAVAGSATGRGSLVLSVRGHACDSFFVRATYIGAAGALPSGEATAALETWDDGQTPGYDDRAVIGQAAPEAPAVAALANSRLMVAGRAVAWSAAISRDVGGPVRWAQVHDSNAIAPGHVPIASRPIAASTTVAWYWELRGLSLRQGLTLAISSLPATWVDPGGALAVYEARFTRID